MALEFVVFDAKGMGVDWIDPYQGHTENEDGSFNVDNGFAVYRTEVPEGGRYTIRQRLDNPTYLA